jgi:hypothetical protein
MADDIEFVEGLIVKAPHERAPDYVKAQISIKVEDLGKWLRAKYKAGDEWVNIDVKQAKSGKWYAAVSNFKPKAKAEPQPETRQQAPKKTGGRFDDMADDIPFAPIGKRASLAL